VVCFYGWFVDAGLIWAAAGTVAAVAAVAVGGWQLRVQILERRDGRLARTDVSVRGVSVAAPTGRLPSVRGRRELLQQLRHLLRKPDGRVQVIAGMGGAGKSTVALALADHAGRRRWHRRRLVWWVSAADLISLTGGMATIARLLGATQADLDAVSSASADGPDRLWSLLERARPGWLLIIDNADEPSILGAPSRTQDGAGSELAGHGGERVGDGTGWMRPSVRGLVLVTSRDADSGTWGRDARVHRIESLQDTDSAQVLLDLAPGAGTGEELLALARRLGGLPLALHLAGTYLGSDFRRWTSATDYQHALEASDPAQVLTALSTSEDDPRLVVTQTWEISLDGLAAHGLPQTRPLLRLLCCFAFATPIPVALLVPELLDRVLTPSAAGTDASTAATMDRLLGQALRGLSRLGLLGIQPLGDAPDAPEAVTIHPVVADTNRAQLLATGAQPDQVPADAIQETAVDLVAAFAAGLYFDQPAGRAAGRLAATHLRSLLTTVAPYLDDDHLAELLTTIAQVTGQLTLRSEIPRQLEDLIRVSREHAARLGDGHLAALAIQEAEADLSFSAWRMVAAEQAYQSILAARARLLGEDHPDTLQARHCVALMSAHQGRWAEAEEAFTQVYDARRRVLGEDNPDTLTTLHCLAWVAAEQGRTDDAEILYRQVIATARKTLGDSHGRTRGSQWHLASAITEQGRWDEAEAINRSILHLEQQQLGEDHRDTLATRSRLAWIAAERGRWEEAETAFQEILKSQQRILGEDHVQTLQSRYALAWLAGQRGHWDRAETDLQKLLSTQEQLLGIDRLETLQTRLTLAQLAAKQHQWAKAETDLRALLEIEQRELGESNRATIGTQTELAWAIARQGRWAEAESMFQVIIGSQQNRCTTLSARHGLAWVTARQGAHSQAEAALREIYHEQSRLLGENHPDALASLHDLAWVTAQQGRRTEAEQSYKAVLRHRERILGKSHPDTRETEDALKNPPAKTP
jgi:tetratricopeptide (TPR) repeat protein